MNMQNAEWFAKFLIPFVCDGDFNDYRDTVTLEQCIESYAYTENKNSINSYFGKNVI